jgi:hypothetical protein
MATSICNAIFKILIVNKFRIWKTLKMWRMTVSFGKISKCKRDMQKSLFMINPTLQKALLEIRAKSVESNARRLSALFQDELRTLECLCRYRSPPPSIFFCRLRTLLLLPPLCIA